MSKAALDNSPPHRPPFQFRLKSLLLLMALASVLLGLAVYYRPLSLHVTYRFAAVDAAGAERLLIKHGRAAGSENGYAWIIADEEELKALLQLDGGPAPIHSEHSRVVSSWPKVATSYTFSRPKTVMIDGGQTMTSWDSILMGGFLGCRRAGSKRQFRVECDMSFHYAYEDRPSFPPPAKRIEGKLFYEGPLPEGRLVFLAPIDDERYHVAVFEAKE